MEQVFGGVKKWIIGAIVALIVGIGSFNSIVVYNEAGYATHIRTIFGEEKVVTDIGYTTKWFGRSTAWKQVIGVQLVNGDGESSDEGSSVNNFKVTFLGNVDGVVEASTRFRLPQGEQFKKIVREYRTPENFVALALVPAVKETLQTTASLMSADDYFAGARSEFGAEFENQLKNGQYVIKRKEISRFNSRGRNQGAGLQSGADLAGEVDGAGQRTDFVTEKIKDANGNHVLKAQQFVSMGVEVVEARITNILPNPQFRDRMVKVQTAQAELAVARQTRLKEEEEKLLVTARGEKEVEQKRQETLRQQIELTTNAETEKKLAILRAEKDRESAIIAKTTSQELLEKAKVDAQATKVAADAEAYAKQAVILADGALDKKLEALKDINKVWAEAAAKAAVPSVIMGNGGNGSTSRQSEIGDLMGILAAKAAKDLSVDLKTK